MFVFVCVKICLSFCLPSLSLVPEVDLFKTYLSVSVSLPPSILSLTLFLTSRSETRLIEVMDNTCGRDHDCAAILENHEDDIEKWWKTRYEFCCQILWLSVCLDLIFFFVFVLLKIAFFFGESFHSPVTLCLHSGME